MGIGHPFTDIVLISTVPRHNKYVFKSNIVTIIDLR